MSGPVRWERSSRGTLFLRRRPKLTLGIVFPNADGTFSWLSHARHQESPARYATEADARKALCAVLGLAA